MQRRDIRTRLGRDHSTAHHRLLPDLLLPAPFLQGRLPYLPYSRHHQRRAVLAPDIPRQACIMRSLGPFIKPVRRDQTPPCAHSCPKGGLVRNRLGPRVDQHRPLARPRCPMRHETPAHRPQLPPAVAAHDNMDLLGRADIEPRHRWQIIGRRRIKQARHRIMRQGQGETSTHMAIVTQSASAVQLSLLLLSLLTHSLLPN